MLLAQGLGNDLPSHSLSASVAATAWRPCLVPCCHGSGLPRSTKSSLCGGEKRRCQGNRRLVVQWSYEAGKKLLGSASLRDAPKVGQHVGYPKPIEPRKPCPSSHPRLSLDFRPLQAFARALPTISNRLKYPWTIGLLWVWNYWEEACILKFFLGELEVQLS